MCQDEFISVVKMSGITINILFLRNNRYGV